uniref:RING-type domain-containing protein n=1 Tax=Globodera rostochiensis TaxID=31243 RepID=A0A914I3J7_GLORO
MNKFNCAHCVVLPLLVLNIIVLSVSVHGGDGVRPCPSDAETESPLVMKRRTTLANLIAIDSAVKKETTLADLIAIDSPARKETTLADLIALEREEEKKNSSAGVKGILSDLLAMERIQEEEFDQFLVNMGEQEQLIGAVFTPQTVKREEKGILRSFLRKKSGKEHHQSSNNHTDLEEKYQILKTMKKNDPAMSQVVEKLNLYSRKIVSGLGRQLKKYLHFTIMFLAKRQRIAATEIVPLKSVSKQSTVAKLIKFCVDENRENKKNETKNEDKSVQTCNSDRSKSNKSKAKRLLQLLLTALGDGNGTANLALEIDDIKRKRRRRKRDFGSLIMMVLVLFIMLSVATHKVGRAIRKCVRPSSSTALETNEVGAAWSSSETGETKTEVLQAFVNLPEHRMRDLKEEVGECAICLDEIDGDEMVRQLPACQHIFHTNCILAWFKQHITCPICRAKVFKTEDGKTEPVGVRQLPTLLQLIETEENAAAAAAAAAGTV